ncbi:hypothetical protein AVEN_97563-1 [Araneus ventricosus]|uniref:Tc3 transposase DNA binding domain-containing protein n=1 Tax=Araneus ventricosus TaxID=182803 RepID=A0A4Y2F3T5_ARAVE|nr:hypothetical protein AVEN_97563-1 [Araneus ventricosus]
MAGYQDLSNFERGFIVIAREKELSISEVAMKFGFSSTIILRVCRVYWVSSKTSTGLFWYPRLGWERHFLRTLTTGKVTSPNPTGGTRIDPKSLTTMRSEKDIERAEPSTIDENP